MQVRLKGKTRHGKNRIKEFGEWWKVVHANINTVNFKTTDPGPWMLLNSSDDFDEKGNQFITDPPKDWRFISIQDIDFEIIETDSFEVN